MGIPQKVEVAVTKVRWLKKIGTHKAGDIEDVSTARIKNLLDAGLVELYPAEKKAKPSRKVEIATVEPDAETATVVPVAKRTTKESTNRHPLKRCVETPK